MKYEVRTKFKVIKKTDDINEAIKTAKANQIYCTNKIEIINTETNETVNITNPKYTARQYRNNYFKLY